MPLEKVCTILKDADKNGYGVAAFNIFNFETIAWAIEAAEEESMPVIIQFYPGFDRIFPLSCVSAVTKDLASKVRVPVGLHLDHSNTVELAIAGMRYGFQSIMFDGSRLPFEENVKLTAKVVEIAHGLGLEVEGELGHVGSGAVLDDFTNTNHFTDPDAAVEYVERTGVDSLAISIGNGHGTYVATPNLDFDRIKTINEKVSAPLVMHGGSDIPDEQMQRSIELGMVKFNIATEYNRAYVETMNNLMTAKTPKWFIFDCMEPAKAPVKEFLRSKIALLNPKSYKV